MGLVPRPGISGDDRRRVHASGRQAGRGAVPRKAVSRRKRERQERPELHRPVIKAAAGMLPLNCGRWRGRDTEAAGAESERNFCPLVAVQAGCNGATSQNLR